MNLTPLTSFHERTLDEWNSTAKVLLEATKTVAPAKRLQTFMQTVIELSEVAGKNLPRRHNLVKAGEVVLHGIFYVKDERSEPTPKQNPLPSEEPSLWQTTVTFVRRAFLFLLILTLCAGAFQFGRLSVVPPKAAATATTVTPVSKPEVTADIVVGNYIDAAYEGNMTRVLELFHPDKVKQQGNLIIAETTELAKQLPQFNEIKTLKVETEETAQVIVSFINKVGKTRPGQFYLKKDEGQWRLTELDL